MAKKKDEPTGSPDAYVHETCGKETVLEPAEVANYRDHPGFFGDAYCSACDDHFPVEEFTWADGGEPLAPQVSDEA